MKKLYGIEFLCGSIFSLSLSFSADAMDLDGDDFSFLYGIDSTNPFSYDDDAQDPWAIRNPFDLEGSRDENIFIDSSPEDGSKDDFIDFSFLSYLSPPPKRKAENDLGGDIKRKKTGNDISPELKLLQHIRVGNEAKALTLLKTLDLSIYDNPGVESPCLLAAEKGLLGVIQYFLENRPDLLSSSKDLYGATCLHLACMHGELDIVDYLMTHQNLLFNFITLTGLTPLDYCLYYGKRNVFEYYLKNSNLFFFFQKGVVQSPIQYAMSCHQYDFVLAIINKVVESYGILSMSECNEFIIDSVNSGILEYLSKKSDLTAADSQFFNMLMTLAPFSGQSDLIKTICCLFPNLKENLKISFNYWVKVYRLNELIYSPEQQSYFFKNLIEHNAFLEILTHTEYTEFKNFIEMKNLSKNETLFSASNHHSLINYIRAGRQGKDVNVLVCDSFLSPPKGIGMIVYNSQLDKKVPIDYRDSDFIRRTVDNSTEYGAHGIAVSGVIVDDVAGISSNANIIPIHGCFLNEVILNNFNSKIINISFDVPENQMPILAELCKNNIVVISAGNYGCPVDAKYSKLLESSEDARKHLFLVSNIMKDGYTLNPMSSYFSEPGKPNPLLEGVGIAAPGTDIVTPIPGNGIYSYSTFSGTSLSAPIVSGAIAKLMSDFPKLSITEIADLTRLGANKCDVYADQGKFGQGFLDIKSIYLLAETYMKKQNQDFSLNQSIEFEIDRINEEEFEKEFDSIRGIWKEK